MIEIRDLTVRFGGVTPLDAMSLDFPVGHLRADRPQRRRQDHVLQRAERIREPGEGRVQAFGEDLLAMPHYRRARWGLRRTFQTEQAIEELSVAGNVALAHEHWGEPRLAPRGRARRDRVRRPRPLDPRSKVGTLGARERRLVEIARAVVGKPTLVLLDEPAAGLPDEETEHLGRVIQGIPDHMGALVILVDHDMSLVSDPAAITAVLDFGKLIAAGPTAEVLRDEHVMKAYLGTEDESCEQRRSRHLRRRACRSRTCTSRAARARCWRA